MHSPAASPSHENEEDDEFKKRGYSGRGSGWTKEEDTILTDYVKKYGGEGKWKTLNPQKLGLARSVDSCRIRWQRYLRDPFTDDEKLQILQLHPMFGNNWAQIAAELPGHTEEEIMNFCKRRRLDHGNQGSSYSSSNQHADISQLAPISYSTTNGSSMFGQGSGLSEFPLIVSPQTMQYNSTSVSTAATTLLDQSTGLSGNNSYDAFKAQLAQLSETQQGSNWGTPTRSIPPIFDETLSGNNSYDAFKAQLAQLLETQQGSNWGTPTCSIPPIFDETFGTHIDWSAPPVEQTQLEPKVLEGSNDDSLNPCNTKGDEQGEPNSTQKEDLNQTDLTNQDYLSDSEWEWIKTLFSNKD